MQALLPPSSSSASEPTSDHWSDLAAHPHRSGRRHQRDARILHQTPADDTITEHEVMDPGRRPDVLRGPGKQSIGREGRQQHRLGRLPDHRVAGHQGEGGVPGVDRHREVEGGDDPTTPSGCQVSINRCPGRSEGIVLPNSWRDCPTARSVMSIISCTSPSASEVILPTSAVTSVAKSSLCSVNSSPQRLTSWPRTGAGTSRR